MVIETAETGDNLLEVIARARIRCANPTAALPRSFWSAPPKWWT